MYGNHFKFQELVTTDTGLPNHPDTDEHLSNLASLWNTLNFLRDKLGRPIYINSAFRTKQVNEQVGGAKRSLHMQGRAADIRCDPQYMDELRNVIKEERDWLSEVIDYKTFIHIAI